MKMIKRGSTIQFGEAVYDVLRDFNPEQVAQALLSLKESMFMQDFLVKEGVLQPVKRADYIYDSRIGFTYIGGNDD